MVGTRTGTVVVGSRKSNAGTTVGGRRTDSAARFARNTGVVGVSVVTLHTDTDVFRLFDHSELGSETLDTEFESSFTLGAERISVAVTLNTGSVGSRIVTRLTNAGHATICVHS